MDIEAQVRHRVAYLRGLAAVHLLTDPQGPLGAALDTWRVAPGSRCEHIDPTAPAPLFGLLCERGARMCHRCLLATAETISVVHGIAPCDGCGAAIDEGDVERAKVLLPVDPYLTLAAHGCPDCRRQAA